MAAAAAAAVSFLWSSLFLDNRPVDCQINSSSDEISNRLEIGLEVLVRPYPSPGTFPRLEQHVCPRPASGGVLLISFECKQYEPIN